MSGPWFLAWHLRGSQQVMLSSSTGVRKWGPPQTAFQEVLRGWKPEQPTPEAVKEQQVQELGLREGWGLTKDS